MAMREIPKDELGNITDLGIVQGLQLIKNFRRIEDAETRELILRLVQKLAPKDNGAR